MLKKNLKRLQRQCTCNQEHWTQFACDANLASSLCEKLVAFPPAQNSPAPSLATSTIGITVNFCNRWGHRPGESDNSEGNPQSTERWPCTVVWGPQQNVHDGVLTPLWSARWTLVAEPSRRALAFPVHGLMGGLQRESAIKPVLLALCSAMWCPVHTAALHSPH